MAILKLLFVNLLSSKKLAATLGGLLASLLVPFLNKKFSLGLDSVEVSVTITSVVGLVATYVLAQMNSDIKTGGATSGTVAANAALTAETNKTVVVAPTTVTATPVVASAPAPTAPSLPPEVLAALKTLQESNKV